MKRERDSRGNDLGSRLQHLRAIEEMSGETPDALKFEKPPATILYLMDHFWSVKHAAGERISYTELKNYSDMMALGLEAYEVEAIMNIDSIFERSVHG